MTQKEANQLNEKMVEVEAAWIKACAATGVPAYAKFVVFYQSTPESIEYNRLMGEFFALRKRIARNAARRERHTAMTDLGLKRVKGALGGVYYE